MLRLTLIESNVIFIRLLKGNIIAYETDCNMFNNCAQWYTSSLHDMKSLVLLYLTH